VTLHSAAPIVPAGDATDGPRGVGGGHLEAGPWYRRKGRTFPPQQVSVSQWSGCWSHCHRLSPRLDPLTGSIAWKPSRSAAVPNGAVPAMDELVKPGVAAEQSVEVDDVVKLKPPVSSERPRLVRRSRHSLDGHSCSAGNQQVAGGGREVQQRLASADRADKRAPPGCLRSGHMQGRFVGGDDDLTADRTASSVQQGGQPLSDTSRQPVPECGRAQAPDRCAWMSFARVRALDGETIGSAQR